MARTLILLAALACAARAEAQLTYRVELVPRTTVRLTPLEGARVRGDVVSMRGDTVVLAADGARPPVRLALSSLRELEVRSGRNRRAGAVRGAAALGLLALVFGTLDGMPADEVLGGVVGNALVGAAAGALLSPRGWVRIALPGGRDP